MNETFKLTLTLTLICLISGGILAFADMLTKDRIAEVKREREQTALNAVLPPHDNAAGAAMVKCNHGGRDWTFYIARNKEIFAGAAVETSSPDGYGGEIRLMLGIDANGKTAGIAILAQKETPGLGANIETPAFRSRLADRDLKKTNWNVKKDGGDIDQITAATISSRAVTQSIRAAVEAYLANQEIIEKTEN